MDKKKQVGVSDFVMLPNVAENELLDNLKLRFDAQQIYTSIGPVVVSMNPYKAIPDLYTPATIAMYQGAYIHDLPPHLFAVAETAYRAMTQRGTDACIIIAGESGAGKTEASKRIMEYISTVAGQGQGEVQRVKDLLLMSNPVLEAFGNAKTNRNNNSSRFGKYMDIQFDFQGSPIGGCISNYLLEKSRVIDQAEGERNFHVFYQLLTSEYAKKNGLSKDPKTYKYLNKGKCTTISNVNDAQEFKVLEKAMSGVGINRADTDGMLSILAGLLNLGNVDFEADRSDGCTVTKKTQASLSAAARFLGTKEDALAACMTHRTVVTRNEKVVTKQTADQAAYTRDALAKGLYERLFSWLVQRINENIKLEEDADIGKTSVIGVLDIYGFEIFQSNSFEQFCINFCNEKLQQIFIELTLKSEQEEYQNEGIEWTNIDYFNNAIICDLIEKAPKGILSILDEECVRPGNPSDKDFLEKMDKQHVSHAHYESRSTNRQDKSIGFEQFRLKHYAGDVNYNVDSFLDKNKDMLSRDVKHTMFSSTSGILPSLFADGQDTGVSKRPVTSGYTFKTSLNQLTKSLMTKSPHYIRCIKPNDKQKAGVFDMERAQHQVRYLGLLENVRVRRAGFAFRQEYEKFVNRYRLLCRDTWPSYRGSKKDAAVLILKSLGVTEDGFKAGQTKIFIKAPQTISELERRREIEFPRMATIVQTAMRAFLARKRVLRMRSALRIQRRFRLFKSRRYVADVVATFQGVAKRSDLGKTLTWPTPPAVLNNFANTLQHVFRQWRLRHIIQRLGDEERARIHRIVLTHAIFGREKPYSVISNDATGNYIIDQPGYNKVPKMCAKKWKDQEVLFADTVQKVSRSVVAHKRYIVLTERHILLVNEKFDLCKSDKCFPIADIDGLKMSRHQDGNLAIHVASSKRELLLDFAFGEQNRLAEFVIVLAMAIQREKKMGRQNMTCPFTATFSDSLEVAIPKEKTLRFESGGSSLPVSTKYRNKGKTIVALCRDF